MVAVAQLVESQIVILVVVGSSPISHPKANTGTKGPDSSGPFFFVFAMHKGREAKASVLSSELAQKKERASEEAQKQF